MSLPPLYAGWLAEAGIGLPEETTATCDTCVMCPKADGTPPLGRWAFRPDVKCCTYTPALPNFLVGRILGEGDPGRASVEDRIAAGVGVSPLGLVAPLQEHLKRQAPAAAGRSVALRCPHFVVEDGTCGIWRHRNGVCATWFCKHDRGQAGFALWSAVKEMLTAVEAALARWCLLELDFPVGRLPAALARSGPPHPSAWGPHDLDGAAPADPVLWGEWVGREGALYRACAERVEALSWEEVLQICGPDVGLFQRVVDAALARLASDEVPAHVVLGAMELLGMGEEGAWALTYSPHDPVGLPALLVSVLHYFDGRPLAEAAQAIAEERGLRLDDALLRTLLDWQVLVPATPGS